MGVYEELGITRIINAWGPMTKIGGSRMRPEVLEAMSEAGRAFVDLDELQQKAGARIAQLIGAEGCFISCGCAAGLSIATAAIIAGLDPARIDRLPDTSGMKNEVVVQRAHRNGYDHAVRQVGVRMVEIGGGRGSQRWELENAINANTAAVFHTYARWTFDLPLKLREVVEIAHKRDLPVIVDAAAEVPPLRNLRDLAATGADVVVFSGGKGLCGPQPTGLVLARPDIIRACAANGNPNHSIGRPMKVGKEEIAGLVRAVELYLKQDHNAVYDQWRAQLAMIEQALGDLPGVSFERTEAAYSEGIPATRVTINPAQAGVNAPTVARALAGGDPGVRVAADEKTITIIPQFLEKGEEAIVAQRLRNALRLPVGVRS
ncbi:MAG TPA: aminotransferase class V-fold PLP-dependent enzyme [Chloroflexota bacterium]|nr:aminotransferase class V-fold PLP-dependent enzyme [Chloroflexota bacterium]